jgi:hypothetical protein
MYGSIIDCAPAAPALGDLAGNGAGVRAAGREAVVRPVVIVHRQAHLLHVVRTLSASGRLAGRLHGRQQQGDQHGDDGDHDEQLDQRKPHPAISDRCDHITHDKDSITVSG